MIPNKTPQQLSAELLSLSFQIEMSIAESLASIREIAKIVEMMEAKIVDANWAVFSQRDERWADQLLGAGPQTLGQAGCLVTCAASILCDAGLLTNPGRLNVWLSEMGGFANGNLFVWAALDKLSLVRFSGLVDCPGPNDTPIMRIQKHLIGGGFCAAQVDFSPGGGLDPHWVRLVSVDDRNAMIMDPWQLPGEENPRLLCPKYGATPAVAIWKAGFYERVH